MNISTYKYKYTHIQTINQKIYTYSNVNNLNGAIYGRTDFRCASYKQNIFICVFGIASKISAYILFVIHDA